MNILDKDHAILFFTEIHGAFQFKGHLVKLVQLQRQQYDYSNASITT